MVEKSGLNLKLNNYLIFNLVESKINFKRFNKNFKGTLSLWDANIRNAFLFDGNAIICKMTQPIGCSLNNSSGSIKTFVQQQPKLKTSKRYVYLFDGLLILVKKQTSNFLSNPSTVKYSSKFKQAISLDKCVLKDLEDDCCFEIQVSLNGSNANGSNNNCNSNNTSGNNNNSNSSNNNNNNESNAQSQEFYLFITESAKQKYQWMSMLCYSMYKQTMDRLLQSITEEQNKNNPLPIPPNDYIFDQPDSPETILFEQNQSQQQQPPPQQQQQTNPYGSSDGLSIKAATLIKLIERLTHHLYFYPKFLQTFLMCFREFCSTHQLLQLLSQRYDVPDLTMEDLARVNTNNSGGIIEREVIKRFKREYQQPIRLKVTSNIKLKIPKLPNFITRVLRNTQKSFF